VLFQLVRQLPIGHDWSGLVDVAVPVLQHCPQNAAKANALGVCVSIATVAVAPSSAFTTDSCPHLAACLAVLQEHGDTATSSKITEDPALPLALKAALFVPSVVTRAAAASVGLRAAQSARREILDRFAVLVDSLLDNVLCLAQQSSVEAESCLCGCFALLSLLASQSSARRTLSASSVAVAAVAASLRRTGAVRRFALAFVQQVAPLSAKWRTMLGSALFAMSRERATDGNTEASAAEWCCRLLASMTD